MLKWLLIWSGYIQVNIIYQIKTYTFRRMSIINYQNVHWSKIGPNMISNAIEISRLHVGPSNEFKRNMINKISLLCCRKNNNIRGRKYVAFLMVRWSIPKVYFYASFLYDFLLLFSHLLMIMRFWLRSYAIKFQVAPTMKTKVYYDIG